VEVALKKTPKISQAEWEVIQILWETSPMTANDIGDDDRKDTVEARNDPHAPHFSSNPLFALGSLLASWTDADHNDTVRNERRQNCACQLR
jgi:hypothetical protein